MTKFLHLLLFILFLEFSSYGQTERVKIYKTETGSTNQDVQSFQNNIVEEKFVTKNTNTDVNTANRTQLQNPLNVSLKSSNTKDKNKQNLNSETKIISDYVTYEKVILPSNENTISSEKNNSKVSTSVNYKQKTIREDIHPTPSNVTGSINKDKRIYLLHEAKDLELEIINSSDYTKFDVEEKQKRLEYIRTLLKN